MENKKIDWKSIDEKDAMFAFGEARLRLNQTSDFCDGLFKKASSLFNIFILFIGGLSSFIFMNESVDILQKLIAFILLTSFLIGFFFLLKATKTGSFHHVGNSPTKILLNRKDENKHDFLYMIECELLSYDERISNNLKTNAKIGLNINRALNSIFVGFIISFILMIIMLII
jgi:hypothetical protein